MLIPFSSCNCARMRQPQNTGLEPLPAQRLYVVEHAKTLNAKVQYVYDFVILAHQQNPRCRGSRHCRSRAFEGGIRIKKVSFVERGLGLDLTLSNLTFLYSLILRSSHPKYLLFEEQQTKPNPVVSGSRQEYRCSEGVQTQLELVKMGYCAIMT